MARLTPYQARALTGGAAARQASDLESLLAAVLRRWRLFIAVVAAFVLLVGIATKLTPKSYTTTVRMMAGNPAGQGSSENGTNLPILNALVLQSGVESAETFATLAQQEGVASEVIANLHLHMSPAALLGHVSVAPTSNTAILNLSVSWRDPQTSATIANAFGNAFIRTEREFVRSQAVTAMEFLSGEIPRAQTAMQQTAADLAQFQASNGFIDANSHTQDVVSKATSIESKIDAVSLDSREAAALLNNAQVQLATLPDTIDNAREISVNPVLTDLQTKLEQVNTQLAQATEQYTDQHPVVISLKKQRAALMEQINRAPTQIDSQRTLSPNPIYQSLQQQVIQYRQRLEGDRAQLSLLRLERTGMAPLLRSLPQQGVQLATLQQRAKLASDVYNALEQKYNDATIAKTTAISDVTIIQPATADSAVVRPRLALNVLVALIVGLFFGAIVVYLVELRERPIAETSEPRIFGLPVIARIPSLSTANRRMLPWLASMTAESFLHLCVALRLKNKRPLKTLAVTSPTRGDGKSTIAFNLGKAMSSLEPRVLVIDADLRRPTLHDLAACSNKFGLSDLLEGRRSLNETVQRASKNLDVLAAGHSVENPVALIQSEKFEELLDEAKSCYSMVIVDTPALAYVSDGFLVMNRTDGTVLVLAASSTNERDAREAVSQFAALGIENLIGVVLNRDRKRVADYSDYFVQRTHGALPGSSL
jgi:capsular exopolysaccharide synthesis family protein